MKNISLRKKKHLYHWNDILNIQDSQRLMHLITLCQEIVMEIFYLFGDFKFWLLT